MGKEIERKFLVVGDGFKALGEGVHYRQGYLNSAKERVVRVRTMGDRAALTVKGITVGATRLEFEYADPPGGRPPAPGPVRAAPGGEDPLQGRSTAAWSGRSTSSTGSTPA